MSLLCIDDSDRAGYWRWLCRELMLGTIKLAVIAGLLGYLLGQSMMLPTIMTYWAIVGGSIALYVWARLKIGTFGSHEHERIALSLWRATQLNGVYHG